ncbi:MAG: YdeI/OmpD-associated family protein [Sediminibacterium sp.]|jgi:uncharacterized protein YdeI (YjbR/CyaY-like superfamily)|nr:YdeI/OmpD-associated family protein [Sediminibacterium sp.]MBX9779627.1 YdeI/OmpD-associated family protein [Chitinophagaceae bacterium]
MTTTYKNITAFHAKSQAEWRKWLEKNHAKEKAVWLIIYKKETGIPSLYYPEAVDEALCFGWIDSKPNKRDEKSYYQFFSQRKPKSNWSTVNKKKVEKLLAENRMAPAGLAMIELAKKTGTWTALDKISALEIPKDLSKAFEKNKMAKQFFNAFPPSTKKSIYEWINNAKTAGTREKRILETVEKAAENIRANQYRQPKK